MPTKAEMEFKTGTVREGKKKVFMDAFLARQDDNLNRQRRDMNIAMQLREDAVKVSPLPRLTSPHFPFPIDLPPLPPQPFRPHNFPSNLSPLLSSTTPNQQPPAGRRPSPHPRLPHPRNHGHRTLRPPTRRFPRHHRTPPRRRQQQQLLLLHLSSSRRRHRRHAACPHPIHRQQAPRHHLHLRHQHRRPRPRQGQPRRSDGGRGAEAAAWCGSSGWEVACYCSHFD